MKAFVVIYDQQVYDAEKKEWTTKPEFFRKDKMSSNTCVLYFTEDAARRSVAQSDRVTNPVVKEVEIPNLERT